MSGYILFAGGTHVVNLLKQNPLDVIAVVDFRNAHRGALEAAGIDTICAKIYKLGRERNLPIRSILYNIRYYQKVADILGKYPDSRIILTNNYTPLSRFVIDYVGPSRVELWEDGLNHYIRMEKIETQYPIKCVLKLLCGYYPKHIFDADYLRDSLVVKDRFEHANLVLPRPYIVGEDNYFVGQPLIEDHLVTEARLKRYLADTFLGKHYYYLPHPREQKRPWLDEIFSVKYLQESAESFLIKQGAKAVHSVFSTVNINLQCDENVWHCGALGLNKIAKQLSHYDFDVVIEKK